MGQLPTEESHEKNATKPSFWYGITNPKWLSVKVHFFLFAIGLAFFQPFAVPYYSSNGLSTPQIGTIEFLYVIIGVVAMPVIGSIADKSGRHNVVIAICTVAYLIPITCLAFFTPPSPMKYPVTLTSSKNLGIFQLEACDSEAIKALLNTTSIVVDSQLNNTVSLLFCQDLSDGWSSILELHPIESNGNNCSLFQFQVKNGTELGLKSEATNCDVEFPVAEQNVDNTMTFVWICLLRSLSALTLQPTVALVDSTIYMLLGPTYRGLWGQQRLFAAIGWGMGAGLSGVLIDNFHSFVPSFAAFFIFTVPMVFTALFWLPKGLDRKNDDGCEEKRVPFCKALHSVVISPIFCITCLVAITAGMFLSVPQVIWPQRMAELGAPKLFFGMSALVVCIFEMPSFFFAGYVVNRLGQPVCFLLMFLAYSIRFGVNGLLTPATMWLALPVEGIHLFCFAIFFAAATSTGDIIAPPGTSSTVQAIIATCFGGIGSGSGVLLASLIYQSIDHSMAFLIYAAGAFCGFLILLVVYFIYLRNAMVTALKRKATITKEEVPPQNGNLLTADEEEQL